MSICFAPIAIAAGFRSRLLGNFKFNSLGQRQSFRPVDDTGLSPHIGLPSFRSGFASAPRIFLTAKGSSDLSSGSADIDIGDSAVAALVTEKNFRFMQIRGGNGL